MSPHRLYYSPMTALCIALSVPSLISFSSRGTSPPWNGGAIHGAWGSTLRSVLLCRYIDIVPQHYYTLCNQVLSCVDEAKYLGVSIASELSWPGHISSISSRANVSLGFLGRNQKRCPHKLKETAYFALVGSVLDYACPIWDPFLWKDVFMLEKVQRKAAHFVCGDYRTTSSITAMLSTVGWNQLEMRRRDVRLALLFKVVHGHVEVMTDDLYLTKADSRTRANHPYKYRVEGANT